MHEREMLQCVFALWYNQDGDAKLCSRCEVANVVSTAWSNPLKSVCVCFFFVQYEAACSVRVNDTATNLYFAAGRAQASQISQELQQQHDFTFCAPGFHVKRMFVNMRRQVL